MLSDMVLYKGEDGRIVIGIPNHFGIMPIMVFSSLDELRSFAMGVLGYCEHFQVPIPELFLEAFNDRGEAQSKQGE